MVSVSLAERIANHRAPIWVGGNPKLATPVSATGSPRRLTRLALGKRGNRYRVSRAPGKHRGVSRQRGKYAAHRARRAGSDFRLGRMRMMTTAKAGSRPAGACRPSPDPRIGEAA